MVIELAQSVYFSLILISGLFCSVFQIKMSHRHIWYVKFSFIFGPKKKNSFICCKTNASKVSPSYWTKKKVSPSTKVCIGLSQIFKGSYSIFVYGLCIQDLFCVFVGLDPLSIYSHLWQKKAKYLNVDPKKGPNI